MERVTFTSSARALRRRSWPAVLEEGKKGATNRSKRRYYQSNTDTPDPETVTIW